MDADRGQHHDRVQSVRQQPRLRVDRVVARMGKRDFPADRLPWPGDHAPFCVHHRRRFLGTGFSIDNINPVSTCASLSTIASASADTTYDSVPPLTGVWRFRVRALDADNQASRWSNSRDGTVSTLTAANAPRAYETGLGANYPNPFNPSTHIPYVVGDIRRGVGSGHADDLLGHRRARGDGRRCGAAARNIRRAVGRIDRGRTSGAVRHLLRPPGRGRDPRPDSEAGTIEIAPQRR